MTYPEEKPGHQPPHLPSQPLPQVPLVSSLVCHCNVHTAAHSISHVLYGICHNLGFICYDSFIQQQQQKTSHEQCGCKDNDVLTSVIQVFLFWWPCQTNHKERCKQNSQTLKKANSHNHWKASFHCIPDCQITHVLQASPLTSLLYRHSQSCTESLFWPPRCVTQQTVCLAYRKPWVWFCTP